MRNRRRRGPFWRKWHDAHQRPDREALEYGDERWQAWEEHFTDHLGMPPNEHWLFGGRRFKPWFSRRWGPPVVFNPFVAELLSKGGGLLPLYVLHLLAQRPRYGNDIMRAIEERTEGRWVSNPGAVYPLLNALEDGGFVVGDWEDEARRTRRNYRLTLEGQTEYERLKQVMRPILEEAISVLRKLDNDLEMNDHQD